MKKVALQLMLAAYAVGIAVGVLPFQIGSSTIGIAVVLGPLTAVVVSVGLFASMKVFHGSAAHLFAFLLGATTSASTAILSSLVSTAWNCTNPAPAIGLGRYASCQWDAPWSTAQAGPPTFVAFGIVGIAITVGWFVMLMGLTRVSQRGALTR